MNVGLEASAKRLDGHNNAGSSPLLLFSTVSMTADLRRHPTTEDPVYQPGNLPVQASV
jgi:hypothetical protein